jgi:hypothetical protein
VQYEDNGEIINRRLGELAAGVNLASRLPAPL